MDVCCQEKGLCLLCTADIDLPLCECALILALWYKAVRPVSPHEAGSPGTQGGGRGSPRHASMVGQSTPLSLCMHTHAHELPLDL